MTLAMASFSCGDTIMKIASTSLPTGQLVFLRGLFITSMVLGVILARGEFSNLRRALHPMTAVRAVSDFGGALFFQSALARMPLADLMAITQINPLVITAASAVVFKEPVGWRRWTAALVGLFGVLFIIRPGTSAFSWWALAGIASVMCATARDLATRRIDPAVPTLCVLFFSAGTVMLGGLAWGLLEAWQMPSAVLLAHVFGASLFSMVGQASVIVAMRSGELSVVAPFRYSLILFAVSLGYLVWGHLPDRLAFVGMAIVVGAGLYTLHREQVRRRETAPDHGRR
jgi:drug/metabolite transporter (DMT)-like permease